MENLKNKNWFKKNWKLILIIFLAIFSLSKCTQSCNRQSKINKQIKEISHLDSVVKIQENNIQLLSKDTADYLNQIRMYKGFDKTRSYTDSLNAENLKKQREQTQAIINQNNRLIKESKKK
ncbi:MAG: hypothetical protein J1F35_06000 [Erysipelotrichales bacterium]|nr:hypothetical protein [Erysipelotrichales bacterium]